MTTERKVVYGITQGDPNGIGMELILRIFSDEHIYKYGTPVLYASPKTLAFYKKTLDLNELNYHLVKSAGEALEGHLNLVVGANDSMEVQMGKASPEAGLEALNCLKKALSDADHLDALVTAPLDKATVAVHEPRFSGHTGFIAQHFGVTQYAMFLVSEDLKMGLVTEHVPVSQIAQKLSIDAILNKIEVIYNSLREDLNIIKPRIAVLGLNPHAGDSGLLGKEELEIIKPAVDKAFGQGKLVYGPYAADSFFGSGQPRAFDAVLAMYHDQGLIPFKSYAFYDGVNFTAGLPIVRTSPDHGTAYDLVGKNIAETLSMRNAIHDAIHFVKNRWQFAEDFKNPLPYTELRRERFRIDF